MNRERCRCKTEHCSNKIFTVKSLPSSCSISLSTKRAHSILIEPITIEVHTPGVRDFSYAVSGFGQFLNAGKKFPCGLRRRVSLTKLLAAREKKPSERQD